MSNLMYTNSPGFGEWAQKKYSYSEAVRVGDRIEISGQLGCDPSFEGVKIPKSLDKEMDQAFRNVDLALRNAGGKGWSQVFRVNSYHLNLTPDITEMMAEKFREWMPDHKPIWVATGVAAMGAPGMNIEIQVVAYDPQGRSG